MLSPEQWVARVIVVNPDGSIVAQRRPNTAKFGAHKVSLIGGKFDQGDRNRKQIAQRELAEELKLNYAVKDFLFITAGQENGWLSYFFILFLQETYLPPETLDHDEFEEVVIIPREKIAEYATSDEIAFENHRHALHKYLQVVKNKN